MPWNARELTPTGEGNAFAKAVQLKSRVSLPDGVVGVLRSLGELDAAEVMAGGLDGIDEGGWLAVNRPRGLALFTWTGSRMAAVQSTSVPLAVIERVTIAWDGEWVFRVQIGANETELYNYDPVVTVALDFAAPVETDHGLTQLTFSVSAPMILSDNHQGVDWALDLQNRLTRETA